LLVLLVAGLFVMGSIVGCGSKPAKETKKPPVETKKVPDEKKTTEETKGTKEAEPK
jgi:hypothetical protein